MLDGLVRHRFGENAELMGASASVHSVVGPFRTHAEPQVGGGETPGVISRRRRPSPLTYANEARWVEVACRASCCVNRGLGFFPSPEGLIASRRGMRWECKIHQKE